uniref:Putative secreted protein n=1 Tax=Ixodes ricinus TaxID=34613 RepID=A0A6B0UQG6_IXORI
MLIQLFFFFFCLNHFLLIPLLSPGDASPILPHCFSSQRRLDPRFSFASFLPKKKKVCATAQNGMKTEESKSEGTPPTQAAGAAAQHVPFCIWASSKAQTWHLLHTGTMCAQFGQFFSSSVQAAELLWQ